MKNRGLRVFRRMMRSAIMFCLVSVALAQNAPAKLKVIDVRKRFEAESSKRASPDETPIYIVRFRLEVSGDHAVYVLADGPKGAAPVGYSLNRDATSSVWLEKGRDEKQVRRPEVEKLSKKVGARWIMLPASTAYEWDTETEARTHRIDESRTVFIRTDMNNPATELASPWYTLDNKRALQHGGGGGK
jgi:hypothetical protein